MLFALGAVSSALDAIQSLTNAKSSSAAHKTGSSQSAPTNPFAIDSGSSSTTGATSSVNAGKYPQISAETMNALFAAQGQSANGTSSSSKGREAALKDLFSQIDADADGKITKSEFEDALGAGGTNLAQADDVFSKMDANADGSVNLGEMTKALRGGHGRDHAEGAGDDSDSQSQSSRGSTSTTTTNADGSTTTTVTYADGFKMSTTVPGAASSSNAKGGGNSPYDWFGQMMQRQAQATAGSAASSMSISV
ncbi:EF-hand domain-containing protein [Bradyrhizobium sp. NBAIM08]|uniref:EF-hand domain-containing protein n=1 Tax=Bradyrhizobium sp. NBAIM08 TaxID=2793815 RepID=UPI001CD6AD72|nr:EF-hand domain-containing protein [Bradyrhizobium sp. NBAIM08]MCA1474437.1 EF-hand domain-containing protein [Bradyrhizobium sp. NBAIM08]